MNTRNILRETKLLRSVKDASIDINTAGEMTMIEVINIDIDDVWRVHENGHSVQIHGDGSIVAIDGLNAREIEMDIGTGIINDHQMSHEETGIEDEMIVHVVIIGSEDIESANVIHMKMRDRNDQGSEVLQEEIKYPDLYVYNLKAFTDTLTLPHLSIVNKTIITITPYKTVPVTFSATLIPEWKVALPRLPDGTGLRDGVWWVNWLAR